MGLFRLLLSDVSKEDAQLIRSTFRLLLSDVGKEDAQLIRSTGSLNQY